jgi:putative acetyltransferase
MPKLSPDLSARVRRGHAGDVVAVAQLWRDAWCSANPQVQMVDPLAHWLARVQADFVSPRELWVVQSATESVDKSVNKSVICAASSAGLLDAFWVTEPQRGYLYQLHVAPCRQAQGLGAQLLQHIGAELSAQCDGPCTLHTSTANTRAMQFYERNAWVKGAVDHDPKTGREQVLYSRA